MSDESESARKGLATWSAGDWGGVRHLGESVEPAVTSDSPEYFHDGESTADPPLQARE